MSEKTKSEISRDSQTAGDKDTERQGCRPSRKISCAVRGRRGSPSPPRASPHLGVLFCFVSRSLPCQSPSPETHRPWGGRSHLGSGPPAHPTSPYLGQMGAQMCGPSSPPRPPPWEPALGLSFSHLHARLGASGCSHPGVGPPLAIWGDFMAGWPDPSGRKDGLALHPRQLLGAAPSPSPWPTPSA